MTWCVIHMHVQTTLASKENGAYLPARPTNSAEAEEPCSSARPVCARLSSCLEYVKESLRTGSEGEVLGMKIPAVKQIKEVVCTVAIELAIGLHSTHQVTWINIDWTVYSHMTQSPLSQTPQNPDGW